MGARKILIKHASKVKDNVGQPKIEKKISNF